MMKNISSGSVKPCPVLSGRLATMLIIYAFVQLGIIPTDSSAVIHVKNKFTVNLKQAVLKVLAYFDLFGYPVSGEEILFFLDRTVVKGELYCCLGQLTAEHYVFRLDEFYSLHNNYDMVVRRRTCNSNASQLLITAYKIAGFLFQFPFVRGIGISGSLSKNCASENADIDYFIITKANRLWIARTLMHLFKKLSFLAGREHWYCMNYFIDEVALEIDEKNAFTAIELITLLPARGNGTMDRFFKANDWANTFYPNYRFKNVNEKTPAPHSLLKKVLEFLLDNRAGEAFDNYFMKLTTRRWQKKEQEKRITIKGNRMGLSTGKHFSKPNPIFFQQKILKMHEDRLNEWSVKWDSIASTTE